MPWALTSNARSVPPPFLVVGTIPLFLLTLLTSRRDILFTGLENLGQDHHPEVSTGLLPDQDLHLLQTQVWKMWIEEGEKTRKAMKMHTMLMSFRGRRHLLIAPEIKQHSQVERVAMMTAWRRGGFSCTPFLSLVSQGKNP
jgi:hypothetical protein